MKADTDGRAPRVGASDAMPKIVFVNRYYWPDQSATSQMLTDLGRGLAANSFRIQVLCSGQLYGDADADLPSREVVHKVTVCRVATTRFGRARLVGRAIDYASFYFSCVGALWRILERGDVLVAKTDPPLLSLVAAPVARWKRATFIQWHQDIFPEVASVLGANPFPGWLTRLLQRLRDASLRAATMNVTIGHRMREYLAARGIPDSKLCVIENWADGHAIQPKPASASALRKSLDLDGRFVVCYSGNLGRAHEYDTLLGAADALKGDPRFVFLVIGGGAKTAELKNHVADRELDNFRFLPYQPRDGLEDSMAAGNVHLVSLLPALEGFVVPSKLYGILAAGRPVIFIGDPGGEVARVIERARCGRSVSIGDSPGLAGALQELIAAPDAAATLGDRGRKLFCERFDLKFALERWVKLLQGVLAAQNTGTRRRHV